MYNVKVKFIFLELSTHKAFKSHKLLTRLAEEAHNLQLKSFFINKKGKDALLASKVPSVDGQKHNLHTSKK